MPVVFVVGVLLLFVVGVCCLLLVVLHVGCLYLCGVSLVAAVCYCLLLVVVVVCVVVRVWCWRCLSLWLMAVVGDRRGVLFGCCCLLSCVCFALCCMMCVVCVFGCVLSCCGLLAVVCCLMLFDV